ncbi:MAG: S4 domain-containing protein, partial [Acidimicrobiales bacterium]
MSAPVGGGVRLQKLLADTGVASRRAAEELIAGGRVRVNGKVAVLGQRADASSDVVEVDGRRVVLDRSLVYLALNKPAGVITTARDPQGRTSVVDLIGIPERVFPVGRLDAATEG